MSIPTPQEQFARAKALRAKFWPTTPPVVASKPKPRSVELIHTTYDHCRKPNAVIVKGRVYGPFQIRRDFLFVSSNVAIHKEKQLAKDIRRAISKRFDVTLAEMDGDRRCVRIVEARHGAMAEIYVRCTGMSLPEIGRMFGGRDHTTVLHALKKLGVWRGGTSEQLSTSSGERA
jgi:hypothetical protein